MLTLKNINATVAKTYFEKGYYQQGRWFGKAAAQLKLTGEITDRTAYNNLLDGYSPGGRKRLMGRSVKSEKHRAAIDCIFNAPKSVSIQALVAGDLRLIEVHRKAVNETLKLMESRYAHSRKAEKGQKQQIVRTGKLAIAQFDHIETRDLDPHLHTHCVVMNVTPRADGKWRSLHNDAIYRHQKLLGTIYQHNLALQVQKLGYQVVGKGHGQFELVGYPEKDLKHFSKRRQAILASVEENASFEQRNRAWGNTRTKKEIVEPEKLKVRWQLEAQKLEIEFVTPEQAPIIPSHTITQKTIADAVEHCSEHGVAFRQEDLEKFLLVQAHQPVALCQLHEAIAQHPDLLKIAEPTQARYTIESALIRELATIREMQFSKGQVERILSDDEIADALQSIPLTRGQHDAIATALKTTDRVMAWQGVAGESKTYTLHHFSQLAIQSGYAIKGFVKSAEAAKVLTNEVGIEVSTVASLLCGHPVHRLLKSVPAVRQSESWRFPSSPNCRTRRDDPNSTGQSKESDRQKQIWIVDEAGLLSADAAYDLLHRAEASNVRLLLVANTQTRSAICTGNPIQSLHNAGMTTVFMNQSKGQRTPELQIAVDLIARGEIDTGFERLNEANCLIEVPEEEKISKIVTDYLAIPQAEREKTLILAGTNQEQLLITQSIREGLHHEGYLGESVSLTQLKTKNLTKIQMCFTHHIEIGNFVMPAFNYKKRQLTKGLLYEVVAKDSSSLTLLDASGNTQTVDPFFYKTVYSQTSIEIARGDRLKWTKNDRNLGRRNGQEFRVTQVEENLATIAYDDGKSEILALTQPLHLDRALVTTTYSSQDKTADRVLISADYTIAQESFYVAVSRSKYDLKLYTTDKEELLERAKQFLAYENPLELVRAAARLNNLTQPVEEDRISVSPLVRKVVVKPQDIKHLRSIIPQVPVAFAPLVEQPIVPKNPLELLTQNHESRNYTNRQSVPDEPNREAARKYGGSNSSNSIAGSGNLERLHEAINRNAIAGVIGGLRGVVERINRINQRLHEGVTGFGRINEQFDNINQSTRQQTVPNSNRGKSLNQEQQLVEAIEQKQIAKSLLKPLTHLKDTLQRVKTIKIPALVAAQEQSFLTSPSRRNQTREERLVEVIEQRQISKSLLKPLTQLKNTLQQSKIIKPHHSVVAQIQTLEQSIKRLEQEAGQQLEPLNKMIVTDGQQQVDLLFSLCVEYLDANEVWKIGNYQFSFDPHTLVLTCQNQSNPDEFLRAVGTEDGWQYQEGILAIPNEENLFELVQELLEPENELKC